MSTLAAAEATLDNSCIRELLFENIKLLVRDLNAAHVNISSCGSSCQHKQQLLFENIYSCLLYGIPTWQQEISTLAAAAAVIWKF